MARVAALIGLVIGLVGLGLDYALIMPNLLEGTEAAAARSYPDAFIYFWTFFTHLTNLALVLIYIAEITQWRWLGWFRQAGTQAMMAGYIALVMVFYHFMLAPYYTFEGGLQVATLLLHYAAPLYYLAWWLAFARHGQLRLADVPLLLIPGLLYVAWVLVRGAIVGEYPYEILNAAKLGYGGVAVGVGIIMGAVAVFTLLIVAVDRWLGQRQLRAAE